MCAGVVVGAPPSAGNENLLIHAPLTLRPSPLPRELYDEAIRMTSALNLMLSAISQDTVWLRSALAETCAADPFTARLLDLLPDAPAGPELFVTRTDYFVHEADPPALRMVEMNTIAASFAVLGSKVAKLHRVLASRPAAAAAAGYPAGRLPDNGAPAGVARALGAAHDAFVMRNAEALAASPPVVLFIVQPDERNSFDQDALRHALWAGLGVPVLRISLGALADAARVDGGGLLCVRGADGKERIASVVYLRAGYTPADYKGEKEWTGRAMIEQSCAAKCPSVAMQLAGCKKVQQLLDAPDGVERFVADRRDVAAIRRTFAKQWSMSPADDADTAARMAMESPEGFVLKPQREGGGNNLYSADMAMALEAMSPEERSAYVLMERIRPVVSRNVIVRGGEAAEADVVSEFGVFGTFMRADGEVVLNEAAGTLLRSKLATQDDGGVAAGVAVLDSPCLID